MESWESFLEIRQSKFGRGLFARTDLEPGQIICPVTGPEMDFEQTRALKEKESHAIQIDFNKYLLCEPPFLYSNHSCHPNCAVNGALEFFALTCIPRGKELFWDYSTSMLERNWTMKCFCGEQDCRKVVTDFDLLPHTLQMTYLQLNIVLPFISHFVQQQLARSA